MKALIRKHGFTPTKKEQDEVFLSASWPDWIDKTTGAPLTDENYGYALCDNCPDDVELTADDFEITEHEREVEKDMGEKSIVKYWTATYVKK